MNTIRNFGLLLGAGVLAGCTHVDPNPAFRELANTVHLRTGKRVQWNRGSIEDAQAQAAVSFLLSRPLTAESAVQIALLNNHTLQATYEELGIAQADLVEAGLLRNPIFTFERRFPGIKATSNSSIFAKLSQKRRNVPRKRRCACSRPAI